MDVIFKENIRVIPVMVSTKVDFYIFDDFIHLACIQLSIWMVCSFATKTFII